MMKQKTFIFGICIALLSVLLLSGCGQKQIRPTTQPIQQQEVPTEQVQEEPPAEAELSGCDAFPDKLDACESFSCEFEHPFTGEMMEKKIVGLVNGKCQYTEEMPNNGRMDCDYPESMRKAAAQFYKDNAAAESAGTSVKVDLESGELETKYTIDGKEVENPLQEATDTGVCVISGY